MNELDDALDKLYTITEDEQTNQIKQQPIKIGTANFTVMVVISDSKKLVMQFIPQTSMDLDNANKNPAMFSAISQKLKERGLVNYYLKHADSAGYAFEIDLYQLPNILR